MSNLNEEDPFSVHQPLSKGGGAQRRARRASPLLLLLYCVLHS